MVGGIRKILVVFIFSLVLLGGTSLLHAGDGLSTRAGTGCEDCVIRAGFKDTVSGLYELSGEELDTVEAGGFYTAPHRDTDYGRIILWDETGDEQGGKASFKGDLLMMLR